MTESRIFNQVYTKFL